MPKKTPSDPTGQSANRNKLARAILRKMATIEERILQYLTQITVNLTVTPTTVSSSVNAIIWGEWEMNQDDDGPPLLWWAIPYIELPYRQGIIQQLVEANRLIELKNILRGGVPTDAFMRSSSYFEGLRYATGSAHNSIKSLAEDMAAKVIREINNGMQAGLGRQQILGNVVDKLRVSRSKAARIVDTEVSTAYNNARLRAVQVVRDETGVDLKVQHISALLPTTRKHHAARHKRVYTPEQQLKWWNEGVNRINCFCSVRSVIVE